MPGNLGDFAPSSVVYDKFTTTSASTGAATTLSGTPALSVYKDNSTTQSTSGVTLTADFDSVTGLNHVAVDTSADGTFYSAGSSFDVVITAGTVGGTSAVGYVVASFTLNKTAALRPTTAGRTFDVASTGEGGLDFSNVNLPAGAVPVVGIVDNGTAQSATATTLVLRSAAAFGDDTLIGMTLMAFGSTQGYWQSRVITDNVGSTDTVTVDTWTVTPSGTVSYVVLGTPPGSVTSPAPVELVSMSSAGVTAMQDAVWDTPIANHEDSGSTGEALAAAGSAGDPWITTLPGSYTAGQAGFILGTNLDATVSSRSDFDASTDGVDLNADQSTVTIGAVSGAVGSVTGAVGSVTGDVGGDVTGSVGSLAAQAKTDVSTAVGGGQLGAAYSNLTRDNALQVTLAALGGKVSGMDTGAPVFRGPADTKNVISATVDADGNRTAVTLNP
jgi:hypothetical protein